MFSPRSIGSVLQHLNKSCHMNSSGLSCSRFHSQPSSHHNVTRRTASARMPFKPIKPVLLQYHQARFSHLSEPALHQIKIQNLEKVNRLTESGVENETGWKLISTLMPWSRRMALYQALSKARLSSLIVLTTMASYALCPVSGHLASASLTTLLATATGTFLCSASANTLNQLFEAPFDAQMSRTRARPLVRRLISPSHATIFATLTGLSGTTLLATMVNPTTAILGATNLILYAFVYTPLKRISIVNTWLGALVGAIPALMGSTAAGAPLDQLSSWLTATLLYFWQFPHFNALAHTLRRDYSRAGYQMMSNVSPSLNSRVSLRYALLTLPLSSYLMPTYGLTSITFGFLSVLPNLLLIIPAFKFWLFTPTTTPSHKLNWIRDCLKKNKTNSNKDQQEKQAKQLFWASLIHLPCLLILMMACRTKPLEEEVEVLEMKSI